MTKKQTMPKLSGLDFRPMKELTTKLECKLSISKFLTIDRYGEFFLWNNPEILGKEDIGTFGNGYYIGWLELEDVLE